MKISEQWLREWVNPALSLDEINHKLTMAGCEVEGIAPVATDFSDVIVGQIVEIEKHPDADKLNVCKVDNGQGELLQIVCGAPNARAGLKAPLALIGAELPMPDGKPLKIKKGKLRGIESCGMLCSASELGMAEKSEGLLELPEDAPLGVSVQDYLKLADKVVELNVTANRGDWLSMAGVAREVGVLTGMSLTPPVITEQANQHNDSLKISLPAADSCPRYAGRIIRNVNTTAKTPLWMKEKLRRLGVRSLSPVVDVTNYILLELGQPMHAFDLDKLQGGIQARYATEGEQLVLLDDQMVNLSSNTLVIADDEKAVALAGIKGGMATAVSNATQNIFLESAHFRAEKLRGQARRYGLQTDASYRFERGVAADLPRQALERATQLIVEICGGSVGPVVDVCTDDHLLDRPSVNLRRERIARILGVTIGDSTVEDILQRLGCELASNATGWTVKPPHSRFDITIEEDLVEELARVYGYDNIPAALKAMQPKLTVTLETENPLSQLRAPLIASGYQEAVTYSFVDPTIEGLLSPGHESIVLANPISAELSHMRSTVWSGLLRAVEYNLNRQQTRVRLFEVGPVFSKTEAGIQQHDKIAGIITGSVFPEQWSQANRAVDFYDMKGDVEAILAQASAQKFYFVPVAHPALHPGQSAEIATDKEVIGWVGALHPALEAKLGFGQNVFLFELDLKALQNRSLPKYQAVSKFPMIRRDLALVVDRSVLAIALDQAIAKVAPPSLIHWEVFDVYRGKGIAEHQKSVALSLILQEPSRTLEDSEVTKIVGEVMASLQEKTGATLR